MAIKDEKTLGFLGLGAMGMAMCYGLVKCGYKVALPTYRREVDMAAGFSPVAPDAATKSARLDEMLAGTGVATHSQKELIEQYPNEEQLLKMLYDLSEVYDLWFKEG